MTVYGTYNNERTQPIFSAPVINLFSSLMQIVRPKLVNARYCDKFAHVRWKDGSIMHVHVSGPIHRNYEQRILSALDSYKKRCVL